VVNLGRKTEVALGGGDVGHVTHGYKFTAFVITSGLLGVLQAFMPPDAFTFDTSG
jgi:branched-chain amino acid transport system permease protein